VLQAQLEQTHILLKGIGKRVKHVAVDLGFRAAQQETPDVNISHRGIRG